MRIKITSRYGDSIEVEFNETGASIVNTTSNVVEQEKPDPTLQEEAPATKQRRKKKVEEPLPADWPWSFKTSTDEDYVLSQSMYNDFVRVYGSTVDEQLKEARMWLLSNPDKKKTFRGMLRFLNGWLSSTRRMSRSQPKQQEGLLANANSTAKSW